MIQCPADPDCRISPRTLRGLQRHLAGLERYGGHGLPPEKAEELAGAAWVGSHGAKRAGTSAPPQPKPVSIAPIDGGEAAKYLHEVLTLLGNSRAVPKFQFERRIDILLRPFIPAILATHFGWEENKVTIIAAEFPLKRRDDHRSTNVDYLLFRRAPDERDSRWILLELKTDETMVDDAQRRVYVAALNRSMADLADDVGLIMDATRTRHRSKYAAVRAALGDPVEPCPLMLVYIAPTLRGRSVDEKTVYIPFADIQKMELDPRGVWRALRSVLPEA